jgi:hypothetical protein
MSDLVDNAIFAEIIDCCRQLLEGSIGVIAASRKISDLRFQLPGDLQSGDDLMCFVMVDSETDHLPVGPDRLHWAPDALKVKDDETAAYEDFHKSAAMAAARRLIHSYD